MPRDRLPRGDEIGGRPLVLDTVGEGGMAVVYCVRHQLTGQLGALKILRSSALGEESVRTKFVQEARIGSRIPSDHVVEVTDAGVEPDGTSWLVMELPEGDTLAERLRRSGPLPITEMGDVLRQVSHGLGAAHRAGVVHRDLKPANVFLARTRRADVQRTVRILDVGIARLLKDAHAPGASTLLAGTPGWMAPEQGVSGMKVSARANGRALGLLALEMIVGRGYFPPNQGLGFDVLPGATARAEALGRPALVPDWFDYWFGRCVAMDPSARFADASTAFEAVASALLRVAPTAAATPPTHAVTPPPTVRATPRTVPSVPPTLRSTPPPAAVSVPPAPRHEVRWKPFALGLGDLVAALFAMTSMVHWRAEPTAFVAPPTPVTPPSRNVTYWTPTRPDAHAPVPLDQNPTLSVWLDQWAERVRNARTLTAEDWSILYTDPVDHGGRMPRARLVHHWTIQVTQGLFTYDPTRSTWFVEPTSAGSPASRRIPADSDDVVVLRLVASDTGFEDAVDVGCVPMTGTYSIRARIVGGSPVICSEAWYDCQSFCAGCSAPGVRRWACCRR